MSRKLFLSLFIFLFVCGTAIAAGGYKYDRSTGSGAISRTVTFTSDVLLDEVNVHLSAAGGADNFTVTLDAAAGAEYDVVLITKDMTSTVDYIYRFERPRQLFNGDKIVIAWANTNSRTYGLEVIWR